MTTYRLTIGKQKFLLHLIEDKKTSFGCQSLKAKAKVSQFRSEKLCKTKNYPVIFWTREDFIENSMVTLFNDISKN